MSKQVSESQKDAGSQEGVSITSIVREVETAVAKDESTGQSQALYIIGHPHKLYKIGISADPIGRVEALQSGSPYLLEIVAFEGFEDATKAEEILHDHFSESHIRGEWFDIHDEMLELVFSDKGKSVRDIVCADDEYPQNGAGQ